MYHSPRRFSPIIKRRINRSESLHFSWSIFLIGILHCLVWSLGVGESYSRDFFSTQNISLKSGGTLSPSISEEEVKSIADQAAQALVSQQQAAEQQQQVRLELEQRTAQHISQASAAGGGGSGNCNKLAASGAGLVAKFQSLVQRGGGQQDKPAAPANYNYRVIASAA